MCGRFARTSSREALVTEFGVEHFVNVDLRPRYNIAPSLYVEAIVNDGTELCTRPMRWGYRTSHEQQTSPAPINARAETVATMPFCREAFQRRRCLIVADGFYEWRKGGSTKTPYFIHLRSGRPFGFAAIWSSFRNPVGQRVGTCAILTCSPNGSMAPIHNRKPVILPPAARGRWLDRNADAAALCELLEPLQSAEMDAYPVSTFVNSPRNDSPECLRRVLADRQDSSPDDAQHGECRHPWTCPQVRN